VEPPPVPLVPDVTVIQLALVVDVHGHDVPVVIDTVPVVLADPTLRLVGVIE
jgi:hypothetical protein